MNTLPGRVAVVLLIALVGVYPLVFAKKANIRLQVLGSYASGIFNQGASEIVAYDPTTQRLFTVNGATSRIDVLDLANPSAPALLFSIDLAPYGRQANSVDIYNGIVAAAVEANIKTDNGKVVFFDPDGNFLNAVEVGALPDMLTFTPNGEKVLVANEGEPNNDYTIDPPGSVSIIDLRDGVNNATVTTAGFAAFNGATLDASIRIFGPGASVAQDLEPEYIAVSHNSKTAWVTLQENNALGILDLKTGQFTRLVGLGFKDHNAGGNGLDPSDRDNANNIQNWPVLGMYQPDAIAAFKNKNETFLITANEGDAREYPGTPGFVEEVRVGSLMLDPLVLPNAATLKLNVNLGRLNVSKASGNFDTDGDYDALYAFGARSFSILTADGERIFDSGDAIEQITAAAYPSFFNAGHTTNARDDRSDNKGPEPEGVTVGKAFGRNYAFIGLERIGGVLVYDLSDPSAPRFVQYINNRNFSAAPNTAAAGDLGPEGLHFISDEDSPTGTPLLIVANEISGTTTVYEITQDE
jgi:DNA-binding beta-propeller fold protein YncE